MQKIKNALGRGKMAFYLPVVLGVASLSAQAQTTGSGFDTELDGLITKATTYFGDIKTFVLLVLVFGVGYRIAKKWMSKG